MWWTHYLWLTQVWKLGPKKIQLSLKYVAWILFRTGLIDSNWKPFILRASDVFSSFYYSMYVDCRMILMFTQLAITEGGKVHTSIQLYVHCDKWLFGNIVKKKTIITTVLNENFREIYFSTYEISIWVKKKL